MDDYGCLQSVDWTTGLYYWTGLWPDYSYSYDNLACSLLLGCAPQSFSIIIYWNHNYNHVTQIHNSRTLAPNMLCMLPSQRRLATRHHSCDIPKVSSAHVTIDTEKLKASGKKNTLSAYFDKTEVKVRNQWLIAPLTFIKNENIIIS